MVRLGALCAWIMVCTTLGAVLGSSVKVKTASAVECIELGFNSETLECGTCEVVLRVVGDEVLYDECKSCCNHSLQEDRYERLVLEVDRRFIDTFGDVKRLISIVEGRKKKKKVESTVLNDLSLAGLTVRYVFGARPTLHRKKSDTEPQDSLNVGPWTLDVWKDFLISTTAGERKIEKASTREEL
jgi:hypothetical protein